MGTIIRPELSEKNKYWIERHRYYELKHFCMQYPVWKKAWLELEGLHRTSELLLIGSPKDSHGDPTARYAVEKVFYSKRMDMLERVANETDPVLGKYILTGIIEGVAYDILKARLDVPCCKDTYYELYRRFFWLLDRERQ